MAQVKNYFFISAMFLSLLCAPAWAQQVEEGQSSGQVAPGVATTSPTVRVLPTPQDERERRASDRSEDPGTARARLRDEMRDQPLQKENLGVTPQTALAIEQLAAKAERANREVTSQVARGITPAVQGELTALKVDLEVQCGQELATVDSETQDLCREALRDVIEAMSALNDN